MQNYNQNANTIDESIMNWLTDNSATILIFSVLGTFLVCGILEFFYYHESFTGAISNKSVILISIALPFIIQGIRCATVANSAKLFKLNQKSKGAAVLFVSLAATIYCSYQMGNLSESWGGDNELKTQTIWYALQLVVWAGFALEAILAISISSDQPKPQPKPQKRNHQPQEEVFSQNGANHY